MHGPRQLRRPSEFRQRLEEKQKVRYHYGISERQLRRYVERTAPRRGNAEATRLELLEQRLDNVVFRLGFAPTIPAARQLVAHGHIWVNGRRVGRPTYLVKVGDEIAVAPRARRMPALIDAVGRGPEVRMPSYLEISAEDRFVGRSIGRPQRRDIPFAVNEAAIAEFYAR